MFNGTQIKLIPSPISQNVISDIVQHVILDYTFIENDRNPITQEYIVNHIDAPHMDVNIIVRKYP